MPDEDFHINVNVYKKGLKSGLVEQSKALNELAKTISENGVDSSDIKRASERFRGRARRLDKSLERTFNKIAKTVIDRVVTRYLSFMKS